MIVVKRLTIKELGMAVGVPDMVDLRHNYFFGDSGREVMIEILGPGEVQKFALEMKKILCAGCGHQWEESVTYPHMNCPKCAGKDVKVSDGQPK